MQISMQKKSSMDQNISSFKNTRMGRTYTVDYGKSNETSISLVRLVSKPNRTGPRGRPQPRFYLPQGV